MAAPLLNRCQASDRIWHCFRWGMWGIGLRVVTYWVWLEHYQQTCRWRNGERACVRWAEWIH
jgi:hypothetical protein